MAWVSPSDGMNMIFFLSLGRLYPVYNHTVMNGTNADAYHNPGATVHIVGGAAGNREMNDGKLIISW